MSTLAYLLVATLTALAFPTAIVLAALAIGSRADDAMARIMEGGNNGS